jgi:hypothetical protein
LADIEKLVNAYLPILNHVEFCQRRVKYFGGVKATFGNQKIDIPTRLNAMRNRINASISELADLKLYAVLETFKTETANVKGVFGFLRSMSRSKKSDELYDEVFMPALQMSRINLYDRLALQSCLEKVTTFKIHHKDRYNFDAEANQPLLLRNG